MAFSLHIVTPNPYRVCFEFPYLNNHLTSCFLELTTAAVHFVPNSKLCADVWSVGAILVTSVIATNYWTTNYLVILNRNVGFAADRISATIQSTTEKKRWCFKQALVGWC